jgi:hypothetical protein
MPKSLTQCASLHDLHPADLSAVKAHAKTLQEETETTKSASMFAAAIWHRDNYAAELQGAHDQMVKGNLPIPSTWYAEPTEEKAAEAVERPAEVPAKATAEPSKKPDKPKKAEAKAPVKPAPKALPSKAPDKPALSTKKALIDTLLAGRFGKFIKAMIASGDLRIVQSNSSLPQDIQGLPIAGGYHLGEQRVYLVADEISPGAITGKLMHEVFHGKAQVLLGDRQYTRLMNRLKPGNERGKLGDWYAKARAEIPGNTPDEYYLEELAAYAVEAYHTKPSSLPMRIRQWALDFIAAIRVGLMKKGWMPKKVTQADLAAIARASIRSYTQGGKRTTEGAGDLALASKAGYKGKDPSEAKEWLRALEKFGPEGMTKKAIIADGYDAIITTEDKYISETVDLTTFQEATALYSKGAARMEGDPTPGEPSRFPKTKKAWDNLADGFIYNFVDRFKDLGDIQKELGHLPETQDAALAEELFSGRARKRLDDMDDFHVRPLLEAIDKAGMSLEGVGKYLHARHAQEANAVLKKRNPDRKDNTALSGMTDKEAMDILTSHSKNTHIQGISQKIDAMNKERLDKLISDGLITKEEAAKWRATYKTYVPLHREQVASEESILGDLPATGSGFHIAGKESKLRAGSTKAVDHRLIIPHIVANYEASATRGEKNLVGQTLLEMVKQNPDPDFWTVDTYDTYVQLTKDGVIVHKPDTRMHDNELAVKVDGQLHRISFNKDSKQAMRLVKEMKNLQQREMPKFFRHIHTVMRFLSAVNTSFNPEFVITNLGRDLQTAGYNLGDTDIDGLQKQVLKDAMKHGIKGMWKNLRHDHSTEWAKYADEFERAGGMVGWMDNYESVEERAKAVEREMEIVGQKKTPRKAIRALSDLVSDANGSIENAVRLSAFVHARRSGMTAKKAASLSKNLTVNFNRKGAMSQYFNLAYLFFNASIQGSARMLSAIHKSNKVRAMVGATIGVAFILDLFNRGTSGEDEDDRTYYDKIPDSVKERNLIIMTGSGPADFIKIPLPWGYNVFHVVGQSMGRAVDSDKIQGYTAAKEMSRLMTTIAGAFNPLSAGSFLQSISPTLLDPAVKVHENKEWHGGPLMPEKNPFGPPTPNSERYFRSASEGSKWIAKELNALTGGNQARPGWWDWSPEWFDMIVGDALGGAGTFTLKVSDTAARAYTGEEIERKNIPFIRKILGSEYPSSDYELYFERANDLEILQNELKEFKGKELLGIRRRHADKIGMIGSYKATQKRLRRLRKQKRVLEGRNAPKASVERVSDQIMKEIKMFNKLYGRKVS